MAENPDAQAEGSAASLGYRPSSRPYGSAVRFRRFLSIRDRDGCFCVPQGLCNAQTLSSRNVESLVEQTRVSG